MFFISLHISRLSAKNASTLNAQDSSLFKMVSIIEYYLPEEIRVAICLIYPSWLNNTLNGTYLGRWTAYLVVAYVSRKDTWLLSPSQLIVCDNSLVCSFAYTNYFMESCTPTQPRRKCREEQQASSSPLTSLSSPSPLPQQVSPANVAKQTTSCTSRALQKGEKSRQSCS